MSLNNMIQKVSSSKVAPLAIRVASGGSQSQRYHHHHSSAIFSVVNRSSTTSHSHMICGGNLLKRSLPSAIHSFSTRSGLHKSILQALKHDIERAKETQGDEILSDFPFKIQEDYPKKTTVTLSREYEGETVVVEVDMPAPAPAPAPAPLVDKATATATATEKKDSCELLATLQNNPFPLRARICREPNYFFRTTNLEFDCTAYPDKISIDDLSMIEPYVSNVHLPCRFGALSENLQKAFHKYLERRGIKPNTINVLLEYMLNKDNREYLSWLQKANKFFEY